MPAEANRMAEKIKNILEQARDVRKYRSRLQERFESPKQQDRLHSLRQQILDEFEKPVSQYQAKWLDEHIASRVAGFITMEDFLNWLSLPPERHGGGFNTKDGRFISRYLEKLVAQGVYL